MAGLRAVVTNSGFNGDVELAEAEAIIFEAQVAIAFENVVNLVKGNESSPKEIF